MRINGRNIIDDEVTIDVKKACEAYKRFQSYGKSDWEGNNGLDFKFNDAIKSRMKLLDAVVPLAGFVLAAKSTFSDWGKKPLKLPAKRRRSVLIGVLSVTGIDISARRILARDPLNLSLMSELAPLRSRKLTNDPKEIEDVVFEIELVELILKAAERSVMSDWLVDPNGKAEKTQQIEIGTVVYGLREADIQIDFGDTIPQEWTRRISADTPPYLGRADGCVILWSEQRGAWIVQPTEGSPMRVRIEKAKLCETRGRRGAIVGVSVTVVEDQLSTDFRMKQQINSKKEPERSPTGLLAGEDLDHARDRLFSIVLAHRSEGASLLSYQGHQLP